mmetsp:Transcript_23964/g.41018  ORF Transcript_23964/g.41018 Transcript_23964/m.41018 type:complete len:199 (-) Transcript_23964:463-1059(-)
MDQVSENMLNALKYGTGSGGGVGGGPAPRPGVGGGHNYRLGKKGDVKSLVLAQRVANKLMAGAWVPLSMVKQRDHLLSSLIGNINGATGRFVMHLSMKIIANLSEHSQNKHLMFSSPGLLVSIVGGTTHMYEAIREESAQIIMNLALDMKNKTPLIKGNGQYCMDAVLAVARVSSASNTYTYAIQTLGYLASVVENKI